mmetsp:Transcript_25074/g.47133  ORF Transcript_25074/g.47133 Transcript_25074/m.47133 type:complete len:868 (-) Transcript_25074:47-2650(-)
MPEPRVKPHKIMSPTKVSPDPGEHEPSRIRLSKARRAQAIDEETRRGLVAKYKEEQVYDDEELDAFARYFKVFSMFDTSTGDYSRKRGNIHQLVSDVLTKHDAKEHRLYVKGSIIVRAPALDVIAFGMDYEAEHFKLEENVDPNCIEYRVLRRKNDHSIDVYDVRKGPPGFKPREFVVRGQWRQIADDKWIMINIPIQVEGLGNKKYIRAEVVRICVYHQLSETKTKLSIVSNINMAGSLPKFIVDNYAVPAAIKALTVTADYFQHSQRGLKVADAEDGEAVAIFLFEKLKEIGMDNLDETVRDFFLKFAMLREFERKYFWGRDMLTAVLKNRLRTPVHVHVPIKKLRGEDAKVIGAGFAFNLFSALGPEAAFESWIATYPQLSQLDTEFRWFRSFFVLIAQRLLGTVGWGVKARVSTGALLSIIDAISDVYMFVLFSSNGETFYSYVTLVALVLSMVGQLLITFFQHRKCPPDLAMHTFAVFTFSKPALDALLVARGSEKKEHQPLDPHKELVFIKFTEIFLEAIPAGIIQIHAFITVKSVRSAAAIVSILMSVLATAFTSTIISYDMDTAPNKRKLNKTFYGFVPDSSKKRSIVFLAMIFISATQILAKSLSTALMISTSATHFLLYLLIDFGIFFAIKSLRGDFWYWIPNLDLLLEIIITSVIRVSQKAVTDYTATLIFRHPFECGGLYFFLNVLLCQASCFVGLFLFTESRNNEVQDQDQVPLPLSEDNLWISLVGLSVASALSWVVFFLTIERSYITTFVSRQTGAKYVEGIYRAADNDEKRFEIFGFNRRNYKHFEAELIGFLDDKWDEWREAQPPWLTPQALRTIPPEFIKGKKAFESASINVSASEISRRLTEARSSTT